MGKIIFQRNPNPNPNSVPSSTALEPDRQCNGGIPRPDFDRVVENVVRCCGLIPGHEGASQAMQPVQNKDRDPQELAEGRIDIRKFAQFLIGQQVHPIRVICSEYGDDLFKSQEKNCSLTLRFLEKYVSLHKFQKISPMCTHPIMQPMSGSNRD